MANMSSQVNATAQRNHLPGRWAGYATAVCAFLFASVSIYWGFGGLFGLDTVSAELVRMARSGDVTVYLATWFAVVAKIAGGVVALALVQPWGRRYLRHWMLLLLGWGGAAILVIYGGTQVALELAVQFGLIAAPANMDWRGFYGHLLLWDPWFTIWGVLMGITAFYYTRSVRRD